jgi:methionyl-tRNA synthetase
MPETSDANWDWDDFVRRNNNELVATWGNLANRVLSFAYRNWEGKVPLAAGLRPADEALLATVEAGFASVGELLDAVKLRAALSEAMRLAAEVNRYLDEQAPWSQVKTDKDAAAKTIYTALRAIDNLKILLAPFLPHTCERLHQTLGCYAPLFGEQYTETLTDDLGEQEALRYRAAAIPGRWAPSTLEGGRALGEPKPLFKKLEPEVAAQERARLGNPSP